MHADTSVRSVAAENMAEERFAERRRIALLERDTALRSVVIRNLLRLGCVVSAKRDVAQVIEALESGLADGAVVALERDNPLLETLAAAVRGPAPVIVLCDVLPEPHMVKRFAGLRFLQKPFDMRELICCLRLPPHAVIVRGK
jgi:DNA-binding response OmpR family regulator